MEEFQIIETSNEREIVTSRVIDANCELVFKAWTDPKHLKNWWGPKGFKNTFFEHDLRSGGKWTFIMHGPDGKNYPNESVYVKIVKPEFVAWNHVSDPKFQIQTFFEEVGNRTMVTFKMAFDSAKEC